MPAQEQSQPRYDRRDFVKRVALGLLAATAVAAVARALLSRPKRGSIPQDLPGPGSIFQPKNDPRFPKS